MACSSCGGKKTTIKYQLRRPDGSTETYESRQQARKANPDRSGTIKPVRVSS